MDLDSITQEYEQMIVRKFTTRLASQARDLVEAIAPFGFIAGGYARWIALDREGPRPGDIDVWLHQDSSTEQMEQVFEVFYRLGYRPQNRSKLAITWVADANEDYLPVQLVLPQQRLDGSRTYGTAQEVLNGFDFCCAMAAIISTEEVLVGSEFAFANLHKVLLLNNVRTPLTTIQRMVKYGAKGFTVPREEIARLYDVYATYNEEQKANAIYYDP